MNAETQAIARELVQAPGFRWMDRMHVVDSDGIHGAIVRVDVANGRCSVVWDDPEQGSMWEGENVHEYIPDLDDAATEGCLQRLLDESGCEFGTSPTFGTDGRRYCIGPRASYQTRGQALARALIAIGKERNREAD